jgi:hypothetical protein
MQWAQGAGPPFGFNSFSSLQGWLPHSSPVLESMGKQFPGVKDLILSGCENFGSKRVIRFAVRSIESHPLKTAKRWASPQMMDGINDVEAFFPGSKKDSSCKFAL